MRKLALLAVATLLVLDASAASRRHIVGRGQADSPFGAVVNVAARPDANTLGRALDLAQSDSIGWIRVQLAWSTIQSSVSTADYRLYDQIIARANSDGLHVLGVLGYATPWDTTAPATETRTTQREHYPPADFDAWSRYVFSTVTHFKTSIHHWEIWNEPDNGSTPDGSHKCNGTWCGTAAQYAQLLNVAYRAVKSADPSAVVLFGGLAMAGPEVNTNFLFDVLTDPANPSAGAFDVMAYHVTGSRTEALRRANVVKQQLAFGGVGTVSFWITEFGYPSDTALQNVPPYNTGEAGQAAYIKDVAPFLLQLGARKIFWNQLFDTETPDPLASYGLLTTAFAKKQSYTAYGDVIKAYKP